MLCLESGFGWGFEASSHGSAPRRDAILLVEAGCVEAIEGVDACAFRDLSVAEFRVILVEGSGPPSPETKECGLTALSLLFPSSASL